MLPGNHVCVSVVDRKFVLGSLLVKNIYKLSLYKSFIIMESCTSK